MPPRPIRFFHQGAIVEVADAAPTRSVLDWLREDARCSGTKEGCNEGDCGACTVVIGELARPGSGELALHSVNACIQFLPTLDGKALFSVEDLKPIAVAAGTASPQGLHPVQQAMVDCHGSQCGFCTPGFVMSLWSTYERAGSGGTRPTRQQLADELSGNLCRCTGYRPILDAGQRMFDLPAARLDAAPVVAALRKLQQGPTLEYARAKPGGRFVAPRTLEVLATLRAQLPHATLLAGCTDIGLWVNKQFRELGDILYVGEVDELKRIDTQQGVLRIGAGASLEAAWRALAARWPTLTDMWLRFASPPIRNAGTMGGNVANGSPIGDSAPVLIALDAQLVLRRGERERRLPLEQFYVDYMVNRLEPGEFLQAIELPLDVVADVDAMYLVTSFLGAQTVAAGANLVFSSPVDFFTVSGIAPLVDAASPTAFPTYLAFNRATASFTMTPVPESSTLLLGALACVGLLLRRRCRS